MCPINLAGLSSHALLHFLTDLVKLLTVHCTSGRRTLHVETEIVDVFHRCLFVSLEILIVTLSKVGPPLDHNQLQLLEFVFNKDAENRRLVFSLETANFYCYLHLQIDLFFSLLLNLLREVDHDWV